MTVRDARLRRYLAGEPHCALAGDFGGPLWSIVSRRDDREDHQHRDIGPPTPWFGSLAQCRCGGRRRLLEQCRALPARQPLKMASPRLLQLNPRKHRTYGLPPSSWQHL